MKASLRTPERGLYYHYKHNLSGEINNYAYEVYGVGRLTEEDNVYMVVYRPLYDTALSWREGRLFDLRPLEMFMEDVVVNGVTMSRFQKITNLAVLRQLEVIRDKMYPTQT